MLIRMMTAADIDGAVALQRSCFPAPFPEELLWQRPHLERHLQIFPQGQLVAEEDGKVVGSASSVRISEETWQGHRNWEETVGGPFLKSYDSSGTTLYGVDISIHPAWRGRGLGRRLYAARFDLVRELRLTRFGTACRLPDYENWTKGTAAGESEHSSLSSEDDPIWRYAKQVEAGGAVDRTLTPLLKYGLSLLGVIHDYMEDEESGNAAALLEWRP